MSTVITFQGRRRTHAPKRSATDMFLDEVVARIPKMPADAEVTIARALIDRLATLRCNPTIGAVFTGLIVGMLDGIERERLAESGGAQ